MDSVNTLSTFDFFEEMVNANELGIDLAGFKVEFGNLYTEIC